MDPGENSTHTGAYCTEMPPPCPPFGQPAPEYSEIPYPSPFEWPLVTVVTPKHASPPVINRPTNMAMTSPPTVTSTTQSPKDYLALSIINLVLCFFPLGIPALVFSCKTQDAVARGDLAAAGRESRVAFILNMVALAVGIAIHIIWIAFVIYFNVALRQDYSNYYNAG